MSYADRVAVVVPTYNEGKSVAGVVGTIPAFVRHIVVVDDGGCDNTAGRLAAVADPRLVVIRHERNRGVGAAIATGYREALRLGADVVAVMGGDGQMDPDELCSLVEPVIEGRADYAKGNRFAAGLAPHTMPPLRFIGNVALSYLSKAVTGYWSLFDSQCGYTAISAGTLRRLSLEELYPGYGVPNDILTRLNIMNATVVELPVTPIYHRKHSHMKIGSVLPSISWLLLRLFLKRLAARRAPGRARREEVADAAR